MRRTRGSQGGYGAGTDHGCVLRIQIVHEKSPTPAGTVSPIDPCLDQPPGSSAWSPTNRAADLLTALDRAVARSAFPARSPVLAAVTDHPGLVSVAAGTRSLSAIAEWATGPLGKHWSAWVSDCEYRAKRRSGRSSAGSMATVWIGYSAATWPMMFPSRPVASPPRWAARRSVARGSGGGPAPHLVAAVTHAGCVVLGQCRTADKSNEVPTARRLLWGLDLVGAVVTVDAMHPEGHREVSEGAVPRRVRDGCQAESAGVAHPDPGCAVGTGAGGVVRPGRTRSRTRGVLELQDRHRHPWGSISVTAAGN